MTSSSDPKPAGDKPLAERTAAAATAPPQSAAAAGPARPATAAPAAAPARTSGPASMAEDVYVRPKNGGFRRAVRSLVSHLVFAMLMVAAAFAWVYHKQIFNRLGDELCTADRLGGYMTKAQAPMQAPPVAVASQPASAPADAKPAAAVQPSTAAPQSPATAPATPASAPRHEPAARTEIAAATPSNRKPAISTPPSTAPSTLPSAVADVPAPAAPSPAVSPPPHSPAGAQEASRSAAAPPPTGAEPAPPASEKNTGPIRLRIEEVAPTKPEASLPAADAPTPAAQPNAPPAPKPDPPGGKAATLGWPPPSPAPQTGPSKASPMAAPPATTPAVESPGRMAATPARPPEPTKDELDAMMNDWQAARQTFAKSKPDAVEAYKRLVSRYPRVVALRGELGNVLYSMGRMNDAAEQYFEAALLHLEGPDPGVAACLVDVIKGIDPERAGKLAAKVAGKSCPYRRSVQ